MVWQVCHVAVCIACHFLVWSVSCTLPVLQKPNTAIWGDISHTERVYRCFWHLANHLRGHWMPYWQLQTTVPFWECINSGKLLYWDTLHIDQYPVQELHPLALIVWAHKCPIDVLDALTYLTCCADWHHKQQSLWQWAECTLWRCPGAYANQNKLNS